MHLCYLCVTHVHFRDRLPKASEYWEVSVAVFVSLKIFLPLTVLQKNCLQNRRKELWGRKKKWSIVFSIGLNSIIFFFFLPGRPPFPTFSPFKSGWEQKPFKCSKSAIWLDHPVKICKCSLQTLHMYTLLVMDIL